MIKFIAYYRVSSTRQGESGLGLEAQQESVLQYVKSHGELIEEFQEVETGKRSDRPELLKAIAHSRRIRAKLIIAKLDRLARNVAFTAALMESGVDFVCADNPNANRLTIHVLAAVAEDEARRISQRTSAALAAYKRRGGKLGSQHPKCKQLSKQDSAKGSTIGATEMKRRAIQAYADLIPIIQSLSGRPLREIASRLNELGHTTRTGKRWTATQVRRVIMRSKAT
jgi:DNA invertase Pin-like site-specific DNA recombinase